MTIVERELNNIKVKLAAMSVAVGDMYQDAIKALSTHDRELAEEVVGRDIKVDELELELDELCLTFLALYAPKALELRYIVAILRMIIDLERIGDHSKVIAKQVFNYHCAALLPALPDFQAISRLSHKMLNQAINAFFERNDTQYAIIIETDREVGRLQKSINQSVVKLIHQDLSNADEAIALVNVVRRLERIADHAKNIAELVPYVSHGTVIRHKEIKTNADIDH